MKILIVKILHVNKQMDEEHYVFVGDYLMVLHAGQAKIETTLNKLKYKYLTPEEKKKFDIIERQKQEYREQQLKKQEYIKLMQKQSEEDRQEKAKQKAKASVANELNFGANIMQFKPAPPQKGG